MDEKKLINLLETFLTVQVSKELPRQGFLYSGFKRNEADSVAAHSFSVALFAYLFAEELKNEGWKIDPTLTLKIALIHDLGESITGDIGTYAKELARDRFDKVESRAFDLLIRNSIIKNDLKKYFQAYQKPVNIEAQVVKFADALDAFVQGFNTPSANLDDLKTTVEYISRKKIHNVNLKKIFDISVKLIVDKKTSVYKGHFQEYAKG